MNTEIEIADQISFDDLILKKAKTPEEKAILEACRESLSEMMKKSNELSHNVELQTRVRSCIRLMDLSVQHMEPNVVKKIFNETSNLYLELFAVEDPPQSVVSKALQFIRAIVSTVSTASDLKPQQKNIKLLFRLVLNNTIGRPKLRKVAVDVASQILLLPSLSSFLSDEVNTFCSKILQVAKPDSTQSLMYILTFLQNIINVLPSNIQLNLCISSLNLTSFGQSLLSVAVFHLVQIMFGSFTDQVDCLGLVHALFDFQGSENDHTVMMAYTKSLTKVYVYVQQYYSDQIPKYFSLLLTKLKSTFLSSNPSVFDNTDKCYWKALEATITKELVVDTIRSRNEDSLIHFVESELFELLKYAYQDGWNVVMKIIEAFFRLLSVKIPRTEEGNEFAKYITSRITKQIGTLYEQPRWTNNALLVLGKVIKCVGIAYFMEVFPIKWPSIDYPANLLENHSNNVWVLQVLLRTVSHSELSYFLNYFIPVADKLFEKANEAKKNSLHVESAVLLNTACRIWDLFPRFCSHPIDIQETFPLMAAGLCNTFVQRERLRRPITDGIKTLITFEKDTITQLTTDIIETDEIRLTVEHTKKNLASIGQFSKNFLPQFFQLYFKLTSPNDRKMCLFSCDSLLSISDAALCSSMMQNVLGRLVNAQKLFSSGEQEMSAEQQRTSLKTMESLIDLLYLFIPYITSVNSNDVNLVYESLKAFVISNDLTIQKKSMKVFLRLCNVHTDFLKSNFSAARELLQQSTPLKQSHGAKNFRIGVISIFFRVSESITVDLLKELLPEVILYSKADAFLNAKAINKSLQLLCYLGQKAIDDKGQKGLETLLDIIAAGIALPDPAFVANAIFSMAHIVQSFPNQLSPDYYWNIIDTALLLLKHNNIEVVSTNFEILRAVIMSASREVLTERIPAIVKELCYFCNLSRYQFKQKTRVILKKLAIKCGKDEVLELIPILALKTSMLKEVRREKSKKKKREEELRLKKKKEKNGEVDEDKSDDEDDEEALFSLPKASKSGTWIMEGLTDADIIDFLDDSANKHLVTSDPTKSPKRKRLDDEFEKDEESGKFIFKEEENPKDKKKKQRLISDEMLGLETVKQKDERKAKAKVMKDVANKISEAGDRYKTKKAGGDQKGSSKYEPFAYVKIDPKQLNKRSRQTSHQTFNSIVAKKSRTPSETKGVTKPRNQRKSHQKHSNLIKNKRKV